LPRINRLFYASFVCEVYNLLRIADINAFRQSVPNYFGMFVLTLIYDDKTKDRRKRPPPAKTGKTGKSRQAGGQAFFICRTEPDPKAVG